MCLFCFYILQNAEMSEGLTLPFELSAERKTCKKFSLFSELDFHPVLTRYKILSIVMNPCMI